MSVLSVEFHRGLDADEWHGLSQRYSAYPLLTGPEWGSILAAGHRVRLACLVAKDGAESVGILPFYQVRSLRRRITIFSLPRGLLAADPAVAGALAAAVTDYARTVGARRAVISAAQCYDVPCLRLQRQTLVLQPSRDVDASWSAMRDKTRNAVRKAVKSGLVLARGWSRLADFYAIYSERMAKKSVPLHPYRYFRAIADAFEDRGDVFIAEKDGQPVGAMLLLWSGQSAVYFAGGVTQPGEAYCTSQFIMWEVVKHALEAGVASIDLGESAVDSGVYRFKTMFGAQSVPIWYYDLLRPAGASVGVPADDGGTARRPPLAARMEAAALKMGPEMLRRRMLLSLRRRSSLV